MYVTRRLSPARYDAIPLPPKRSEADIAAEARARVTPSEITAVGCHLVHRVPPGETQCG